MASAEKKTPAQQWESFLTVAKLRDADHRVFNRIIAAYSEPTRGYHNLDHILHCLKMLGQVRDICPDVTAVEASIWFHDIVYDAKRNDNEELSADVAVEELQKMGGPADFAKQVKKLILDTRHQQQPDSEAGKYMTDIDLTSLGFTPDQFDSHGLAIRKEYVHLTDEAYGNGRKAIFERLLTRPTIYYTDYFRSRYETPARENLERALRHLRK